MGWIWEEWGQQSKDPRTSLSPTARKHDQLERASCGNSSPTSAGSWGQARGGHGVGMGCLPARQAAGPSPLNCKSEMLTAAHSPSAHRQVGAKARQGGCAGPGTARPRGGPGRKGPQLSLPGKPSQSCYFGGQKPSPSPGPPPAGAQGGPSAWGMRWHTCPPTRPQAPGQESARARTTAASQGWNNHCHFTR